MNTITPTIPEFPITEPGIAMATIVGASIDTYEPGEYLATVDPDGTITLSWPTPDGPRAVTLPTDQAGGRNLRGLLTAIRRGMIR